MATRDVLDFCDEWRDLKKKRYKVEGAKTYGDANMRIQKTVKKPNKGGLNRTQ